MFKTYSELKIVYKLVRTSNKVINVMIILKQCYHKDRKCYHKDRKYLVHYLCCQFGFCLWLYLGDTAKETLPRWTSIVTGLNTSTVLEAQAVITGLETKTYTTLHFRMEKYTNSESNWRTHVVHISTPSTQGFTSRTRIKNYELFLDTYSGNAG